MQQDKLEGSLRPDLYRLSWFRNGDRLDVAVVANRLVACGRSVWRLKVQSAAAEAGDYFAEASPQLATALQRAGITIEPWAGVLPDDVYRVRYARAAVLAGKASAYPYYGYYALALARLGYTYEAVDGAAIAAGILEGENIAILPGGFSNWGLDTKEESSGADAAFRSFLASGGTAVASCGGAYYLSRGRPAWLGVADARPVFTQEYLRTGVGIVTCQLAEGPYRLGLPPTLEIPYYHGPVYDEIGQGCTPLLTFRDLYGHGRLFIDNPLSKDSFSRSMQGRTAALRASGPRGEAVLFAPHPEMGDLLRKYMALESYIPHYLPIRGELVMRETLDSFTPAESRSFLLVLNAVEDLLQNAREVNQPGAQADTNDLSLAIARFSNAWLERRAAVQLSTGSVGNLEHSLLTGFDARFDPALRRLEEMLKQVPGCQGDGLRIVTSFLAVADHACNSWSTPPERRPAELLLELELALLIIEAWGRLAEIHILVSSHD